MDDRLREILKAPPYPMSDKEIRAIDTRIILGLLSEKKARKITLTLPGERPISWNKMYAGLHWSDRRKEAARVHLAVRVALDPNEAMFDRPVAITVRAYFKNKRAMLDCSNIAAKLYEDGLIGWLIQDDAPEFVRSMTTVSLLDRQNPRVEIEIEEITDG